MNKEIKIKMLFQLALFVSIASLVVCCAKGFAGSDMQYAKTTMATDSFQQDQDPVLLATNDDNFLSVSQQARIVIYHGSLTIVVEEVQESINRVKEVAKRFDGYVQHLTYNSITIRIPVAHFDETIALVEEFGKVTNRDLEAIDVTEEYVDLQARLSNALKVRTRLEALMEKATTVEETLKVELELKRLGEEIEQIEGKLKLIKNQVSLSTLSISFVKVDRPANRFSGLRTLPFPWLRDLKPDRLWW